jgi:glucose-6-phosphate 1-dehydrogenase
VAIVINMRSKAPGEAMVAEHVALTTVQDVADEMEPYERLLGDATLFTREDAVEASWRVVEPIVGDRTPVHVYEPGTWGPAQAEQIISRSGGWHDPEVTDARKRR